MVQEQVVKTGKVQQTDGWWQVVSSLDIWLRFACEHVVLLFLLSFCCTVDVP